MLTIIFRCDNYDISTILYLVLCTMLLRYCDDIIAILYIIMTLLPQLSNSKNQPIFRILTTLRFLYLNQTTYINNYYYFKAQQRRLE